MELYSQWKHDDIKFTSFLPFLKIDFTDEIKLKVLR